METKEIRDILISWFVLSVAFMFLLSNISLYNLGSSVGMITADLFVMYLFIVAVSFLSHELGHRQVARIYGFSASYQMWPLGVILALISSLLGFLIAAPGAVVISQKGPFMGGRKKLNEIGLRISVAGIAINIALSLIFTGLLLFLTLPASIVPALQIAAYINVWLALFNLIPIPPLDGSKVFYYSRKVWLLTAAIAFVLFLYLGFFFTSVA